MSKVQLVKPVLDDLGYLAQHLRDADRQELAAVHGVGLDLLRCLQTAVRSSEEAWVAVTAYGEPIAVFGLAPVSLLGGIGCPWMLGTDVVDLYAREVVRLSRQHVARWSRRYSLLFNYVDARNLRSIEWLRHTGFTILPAQPYGQHGEPFHRFERCM